MKLTPVPFNIGSSDDAVVGSFVSNSTPKTPLLDALLMAKMPQLSYGKGYYTPLSLKVK
jgi:hypothetical protein